MSKHTRKHFNFGFVRTGGWKTRPFLRLQFEMKTSASGKAEKLPARGFVSTHARKQFDFGIVRAGVYNTPVRTVSIRTENLREQREKCPVDGFGLKRENGPVDSFRLKREECPGDGFASKRENCPVDSFCVKRENCPVDSSCRQTARCGII